MSQAKNASANTQGDKTAAEGHLWAPLDHLRHEVDRIVDTISHSLPSADTDDGAGFSIALAVDVLEKDDRYEVTAELPGIDEKDVDIAVIDGTLILKGEKRATRAEHEKCHCHSERTYGSFLRSFDLPPTVDETQMQTTFDKGVLTVTLPKKPAANAEGKIDIQAA